MLLTGDTNPFMDLPGQEHFSQMAQMYRDIYRYNIGWLVSKNNHPMCINLSSPQPVPATEQDVYGWKATTLAYTPLTLPTIGSGLVSGGA